LTFEEAVETVKAEISDDKQATGFDNAPEARVVSQVGPGVPVVLPPVLSSPAGDSKNESFYTCA
jgi:hypothetical protein